MQGKVELDTITFNGALKLWLNLYSSWCCELEKRKTQVLESTGVIDEDYAQSKLMQCARQDANPEQVKMGA